VKRERQPTGDEQPATGNGRRGLTAGGRVLGLDPGTRHFGWGVVEKVGTRLTHVAHGVISPDEGPIEQRLLEIDRGLAAVIRAHAPAEASIEMLFFHRDAQAAAKLGQARGIALLACARAGLAVFEYAPARVKQTVAGIGRADKAQVAQMVRALLALRDVPRPDAADALALAVTHLQRSPAPLRRAEP
jgi:crossover junction endodeoxyribonuclease RuvC